MTFDLLDFDGEELYFDESLNPEAKACLDQAAERYAQEQSEMALLRAYFLEPRHPMVLVALYRYYYYQHRLTDALIVAERVLRIMAQRLELPLDWHDLTEVDLGSGAMISITQIRFYLLALKGAGYLELRLGDYDSARERLQKVVELDAKDRLGGQALLEVACKAMAGQPDCESA
jgi:tetratricopeptide (TPR) repeat protein